MSIKWLAAAALTLSASAIGQQPGLKAGEPPLSEQARRSAGEISPSQRATRFDRADLAFRVLPGAQRLEGIATLDLTILSPLRSITLDLDPNFTVSEISANGRRLAANSWSNPQGQLRIPLPRAYRAGQKLSLRIAYAGTPHVAVRAPWDGGIVWSRTPSGAPFVATAHQLQGCDLQWPCFDHPQAEPEVVDLHITVPPGLSAPGNGVPMGVRTLPSGERTFSWRVKRPNTYALALNVAPYEVIRGDYKSRYGNTIPMEFWHLPGKPEQARKLFAEFAPTLDFFETMIGPYPFGDEKVGVAETPHLGMEHQTMNAYGNNYGKDAYGFDWLFQHEFAHEWFANQLTNAGADDFWLHEGYANYMQPLYTQWRSGELAYAARMFQLRSGLRNCYPIVSGQTRTIEQVYLPEHGPSGDIYSKAAWMLHTLRNLIGDKAFFTATRRIVYGRPDPRPGNFKPRFASTDEFVRIVNEEAGADLGWFFNAYLRQAQLPELLSEQRDGRLLLRWKAPGGGTFPLPVQVQVNGQVQSVPMRGGAGEIAVPQGAHVVLDPGGKILRRSAEIDALQQWQYEEQKRTLKAGAPAPQPPCIAA